LGGKCQVKYYTFEDIKRRLMTYEQLCEALENGTPEEKLDAEIEILGRFYYLND